jgi:hypothetical protein
MGKPPFDAPPVPPAIGCPPVAVVPPATIGNPPVEAPLVPPATIGKPPVPVPPPGIGGMMPPVPAVGGRTGNAEPPVPPAIGWPPVAEPPELEPAFPPPPSSFDSSLDEQDAPRRTTTLPTST